MIDESRIQQTLEELLGSDCTPEEACAGDPELLHAVRIRWDLMQRVEYRINALFPLDREELAAAPNAELPSIDGYEVQCILGRGGMGVVFKARQLKLNRFVALKTLLAGVYAGPRELARFRREAEAVAALRHPHIVQIHDVGELASGPYFTLELVEGGNLAQKLASTPQPVLWSAELVRTLAEAVAVAHMAGIIHRDLKPSNILLTVDGTPKISDFGLARRMEGEESLTLRGTAIGTPSYMAPEQAEGRSRDVGPAADTYALGAILYELLTGRPPFRGETAAETLRQVISLDPVPPSRLNAAVPRDLETVCLKCLEKDAERRYPSALALAEDLRRWRCGEPITARPATALEHLLRWMRRHPSWATLVVAKLALAGLSIVGGIWLVQQRAERRAELRSGVGTSVAQAVSLRKRFHFHEAREMLEATRQRSGSAGPDDLGQLVEKEWADLDLVENLDTARLRAAEPAEGKFETASAESLYAELLYEQTWAKAGLGAPADDCEVVAARVRNSTVQAELVAALDDWASITSDPARREWLLAVARGADRDLSRNRLRQPGLWDDGPGLTKLVKDQRADELTPQLTTALGRVLRKTGGDAVPLLIAAQARYPQDFWLNFELASALYSSERSDEALGFYRAALALRPRASLAYNGIGVALRALGRQDEAMGQYERALDIDPNFAAVHNNLAFALHDKGRLEEAIGHWQQSIRLNPTGAAFFHINLGSALLDKGRLGEAIGHFQEAIRLDPKASAKAHNHLGDAFRGVGQLDEAIGHFQESIRLNPMRSARAHNNLGLALWARGQQDEAINQYQEAIRLDPKGSILTHNNLGNALRDKGQLDEAINQYQEAIRLDPKSAVAHNNLGVALRDKGRLDEAISHCQESIRLDPKASASAHNNLGLALYDRGQVDEAISQYQEAIRLDPKASAKAHTNLGFALRKKDRLDMAIGHFQESIQLDPKGSAMAHFYLGVALRDKGRLDEAIGHHKQSLELNPKLTMGRRHLYSCLYAAACAAVRDSIGQGSPEIRLGEQERVRLRQQALDRLRADLELRPELLKACKLVDLQALRGWSLSGWQTDPALAKVRDEAALMKLPDSEREQWQRLWADVAALLAADPLDQGLTHAARREWDKAAGCYKRVLERDAPDGGHFWFEYAAVLLLSGDRKGYEKACAHMVEQYSKSPNLRAYHMARACTLASNDGAKALQPGRLAETELKAATGQFWSLTERGALHYRAGQFREAAELFEQSLHTNAKPGQAVQSWLWLALAQQRLGKTEEARRWLGKATAWLDQYRAGMPVRAEEELGLHMHNWLESNVLRREAEAMIRSADSP